MKKRIIIGFLFIAVSIFASTYADMFFEGQSNIAKAQERVSDPSPIKEYSTPLSTEEQKELDTLQKQEKLTTQEEDRLKLLLARQANTQQQQQSSTTQRQVTGWMWSDNVGWISLNCSNTDTCANNGGIDYGVTQGPDGSWSGYAWNQNIGWLDFDAGCPDNVGGTCSAQMVGNQLLGWAKFVSGNHTQNGWDGWVSFSSQNDHDFQTSGLQPSTTSTYGATFADPAVEGYAWGSTVVGWIGLVDVQVEEAPLVNTEALFLKPTSIESGPLSASTAALAPNEITVNENTETVILNWYKLANSPTYTSCTLSSNPAGSTWDIYTNVNPGAITIVPDQNPNKDVFTITPNTDVQKYTLSCDYNGGTHTATARVDRSPTQPNQCFVTTFAWGNNAYCPPGTPGYVTPAISWSTANAGQCSAQWLTGPTTNNYTAGYQTVSGSQGSQYNISCLYGTVGQPISQTSECTATQPLVLNYLNANDPFCQVPPNNNPGTGVPQCRDGIDNDGDGLIDHSSVTPDGETPDNGCTGPNDNSEKLIKTIIKEI